MSHAAIRALALAAILATCALTAPAHSPAVEYHTTCVGHGWVAGSSPSDGSAFSRIETGCGTTARECKLYNWGVFLGSQITTTTTCNAWLRDYGNYTECASYAKLNFPAAFSEHNHTPDGYCASLRVAPIGQVDPIPDEPMEDSAAVQPAGTTVIGATAPDPDGGPDFAVRVYPSQTGQTCPEAGRVKDGVFGQQYEEGWQPLELSSAGACSDLDTQPVGFAISNHPAAGDMPSYVLVYGAVSADVVSVAITIDGKSRDLSLSSGTFLAPTRLEALALGVTLTLTLRDGTTEVRPVPVPSES